MKQQTGYGEAEALLVRKHPEYFNWSGGSQWQGRIYSPAKLGIATRAPMIYHGRFGTAFFQTLYTPNPSHALMFLTSLEYHALVSLPLLVVGSNLRYLLPIGVASIIVSLAICAAAAAQADLPRNKTRFWSRPLVALLYFLQPIVRGIARYQGSLRVPRTGLSRHETLNSLSREGESDSFSEVEYWNDQGIGRLQFVAAVIERLDRKHWLNKTDAGWNDFDIEIYGGAWTFLRLTTVEEALGQGKQVLRCRLRPEWTFFAKVTFFVSLGLQLLVIGLLGNLWAWLLLTLPALPLFLAKQKRDLKRITATFLDQLATDLKLKKIRHAPLLPS